MENISVPKELRDDSPLAIVEASVSSFSAQSPPVTCTVEALIDTGASWSVITEELARETGILNTMEIPSHLYNVSTKEESSLYAATIAIQDFTLTTLVYANLVLPPNATYRALLGCAVLWYGQFRYDGMSSPKASHLNSPGENSARNNAPAGASSNLAAMCIGCQRCRQDDGRVVGRRNVGI